MVQQSINNVVPPKARIKKNGRIVSTETKTLYEERARQYQKSSPTNKERKKWNRKIRSACIKDYRTWITGCTQRIEQADNRGDTRAIYSEVKRLSGTVSRGANTGPTASYQGPHKSGAAEVLNRAAGTWADETAGATRNSDQEELAGPKENVTEKYIRNSESEKRTSARSQETVKNTRNKREEELVCNRKNKTICTPRGARGDRGDALETGTSSEKTVTRLSSPADLANN